MARGLPPDMNKNLSLAKTLVNKLCLPMKIISVEEDEDGALTFRYSSENKVELRDLVKKIQEETQRKIIMHQVGLREEVKMLANVGPCGQKLCCSTFLKTIPALSSDKYSEENIGLCSKPMCCLAFEGKSFIKKEVSTRQIEAEPIPQTQPQAIAAKPQPQRILRVLPQKKSRHRR